MKGPLTAALRKNFLKGVLDGWEQLFRWSIFSNPRGRSSSGGASSVIPDGAALQVEDLQ